MNSLQATAEALRDHLTHLTDEARIELESPEGLTLHEDGVVAWLHENGMLRLWAPGTGARCELRVPNYAR